MPSKRKTAACLAGAVLALACASPPPAPVIAVTVQAIQEEVLHPYVVSPEGIRTCLAGEATWPLVEVHRLPDPELQRVVNGGLRALLKLRDPETFPIALCEYGVPFEYERVAEITAVGPGLLSLASIEAINVATLPGAMTSFTGVNIDLETGRFVRLEDVFEEGSGYRAVLSEYLVRELVPRCDTRAAGLAEQANPGSYDYENFVIRETGFEILFPRAGRELIETGPIAFSVPVPWSRLRPLLAAEGPVTRFLAALPEADPNADLAPLVPRSDAVCE